jgi:hypothetical protein
VQYESLKNWSGFFGDLACEDEALA